MTTIHRLGKDTLLYALGTFARRSVSLLLIPIYTSVLAISEYGAVETLSTFAQSLLILVNFGLSNALLRFYSECQDEQDVFIMVRTSSVMVLGLSLGLFILCLPFFNLVGTALFRDETYGQFVAMAFLWAVGAAFNEQLFAYYRARQDARKYVFLSVGTFVLLMVFNIALVRILKLGVFGVLLGNLAVVWIVNVLLVFRFWRQGWKISRPWMAKLLRFGLPLVFSRLGWLILNSADRYFLAYYRDLAEVGLYGLGYKVGLLLQVAVITPFQLAWSPYMFAQAAEEDHHTARDSSRVFTYLLLAICFVSLLLFLFAPEIVSFLGTGKFVQAEQVAPFVLVAYLFNGIYYWAGAFLHYVKKTSMLSVIVLSMAGLTLLLNWLWVPAWGWLGAAWATVVTIGGTGLLMMLAAQRLYPVLLETLRLLKIAAGIVIVLIVNFLIPPVPGVFDFLMRGGALLFLPITLWVTNFLSEREIRFIIMLPQLLRKKIQFALN
ncbi:MAG: oligosaccharide flippase family protein [Chloroflexota bacterium]|nr:oligosaccharide flippase family protein [Chloroflexota bacterium]